MRRLIVIAAALSAGALCGCGDGTAAGVDGLISSTPEPAGANCENGGTRLDFGLDSNANGTLDEDEIESTQYACDETDGRNGEDGDDGDDGSVFQTLVDATDEPAGANCANGGQRVDFGIDENSDGVLDAGEIEGTVFVCNGQAGADTLISSSDEPAGANCAAGGARLDHGIDDSNDGVLDALEVDGTTFLCHGVDGIAGLESLVSMTPEAAGANCANGGQRVDQGLDDSADGVLDPGEIDSTTFVCDAEGGANGFDALVAVTAEAAGANCIAGGSRIDSGTDTNDDAVLDAVEVTSTSFACNGLQTLVFSSVIAAGGACGAETGSQIDMGLDLNNDGALQAGEITTSAAACQGAPGADGADGFDALVTQTAIAAGAACGAATGVQVDSGLDTDRSGSLDAGEVVTSNTLCNGLDGSNGAPGANGSTSLVVLTDEAAGANCANGGTRVDAGLDTDDSNILDADEIIDTRFVCNGAVLETAVFVNGSFESGDFIGWTIVQPNGGFELHAIVGDGETVVEESLLYDFSSGLDETVSWCGEAPSDNTYSTTDGTQSAVMFIGAPGNMRFFQDISIPVGATTLSFDMRWHNTSGGWRFAGIGDGQNLMVNVRNPADDALLDTIFQTSDPLPTVAPALTNFTADISAFAGQSVRVDFFSNTFDFCQWFQFDNIVIN